MKIRQVGDRVVPCGQRDIHGES